MAMVIMLMVMSGLVMAAAVVFPGLGLMATSMLLLVCIVLLLRVLFLGVLTRVIGHARMLTDSHFQRKHDGNERILILSPQWR